MTLKTVTVTGQIYNPDGTPAAGVEGYATLNRPETDNGIVIPTSTFIKADADGRFSIQLWPNARGSGQSQYIVKAYTRRASVLNLVIMVPDVDVPVVITDIAIAQPYPPIDQSLQALLDVQAASVIAQAAKVEALAAEAGALASAQSAAGSATSAGQSAETASTKAGEASTSAQSAFESKNAAALSEQNAGEAKDDAVTAKDKAEAWAENPEDDEVEPGQYSAKHHAIKAEQSALSAAQSKADAEAAKGIAEEKALAASGSATSAGQSASNAAGSALSASEDRIAAQEAAGLASGSADDAETSKTKAQQWASNPENTQVEGGLYSALHYSAKASTSATSAADSADNALEYKNTAETAKTDAQSARDKSAQWAENPVNAEVEPGKYSALHHATKAADSAGAANQSAIDAAASAASIETSVTASPNKIPKANAQGKIDSNWIDQTVFIKDPLRASVEGASGGRMTVLYTASGNPSYMHILPSFNCEDIAPGGELGSGLHPGFVVNGVNKSELFIGAYQARMIGAEAVSLPGVAPRASINFDAARAACAAAGTGWHLMTNWEWAAIALWCMANGFEPRGNTQYGRHHVNRIETGRKVNGGIPGDSSASRPNLTGSGPASWAHDGTVGGIHDLVGNVWEWNDGLRLQDGRVFMPVDNNYLADEADWVAHDLWFSSSSATASSTLKLVTNEADVIRNGEIGSDVNSGFNDSQTWGNLAITGTAPLLTRQALIAPSVLKPVGRAYARTYGARFPFRGGNWENAGIAGLAALYFYISRVYASANIGFRVAFAL